MVKNPKFLKNLLTTASAMAIGFGAANAMAANKVVLGGQGDIQAGGNIRDNTGVAPKIPAAGDTIFIADNGGILMDKNTANLTINLYGFNAPIEIDNNTVAFTIANTIDAATQNAVNAEDGGVHTAPGAADANAKAGIVLTANATYALNPASTALVNSIDLANKGNLTIGNASSNSVFTAAFKSTGGAKDIIVDATNITLSDVVPGTSAFADAVNKIGNLTLNDGKSVILNTNLAIATNVILGNAGAGGATLTVNDGKNITAAEIQGSATTHGKGDIVFQGSSVVAATTGTTKTLNSVTIGNGTVEFQGTGVAAHLKATNINLSNANSVAKFSTRGHAIVGDVSNTSGTNNQGVIELNGNLAHSIAGKVGVDANSQLSAIKFTNAGVNSKLSLLPGANPVNGLFVNSVTTDVDNTGIVVLRQGAAQAIYGDLGTESGNKLNLVQIHSDGAAGVTTVTLKAGKKITATTVDLVGANLNNVLVLEEGTKINGNVDAVGFPNGTIQVKGNTAITGTVGTTNAIAKLDLSDGTAAGKKITIGGTGNQAFGITAFGANDATVELTGAVNSNITTTITTGGNPNGIVTSAMPAGQTLTLLGQIGDVATNSSLKLLQAKSGGNLALGGGTAHIAEIDMSTADGTLTLANAGNYKIEKLTHDNGKVRLQIPAALTLKNGTVLSTADNTIRDLYFVGNNALTIEDGVNLYTTSGFSNDAAGNGSLVAKGTSTVSGKIGNNNTFGDISIDSAGTTKILTLTDEVNSKGDITVNNTDTIVFKNNVTANTIVGGAAGKGTAEFANTQAATIGVANAGAAALGVIKVSGGDLNFTNQLPDALAITFGSQAATITATGDQDLTGVAVTTQSTTPNQNFKLTNGDLILDTIGAADKHLGTFSADSGKLITVRNANFFASVGGTDANASFQAVDGKVDNIGFANAVMGTVTFVENTTVSGNSYAKTLSVAPGKTGTFGGIVAGGVVTLDNTGGVATTATFNDGSTLVSTLNGTIDAKAIANFAGGSTIKNGIGKSNLSLAELNFTDTSGTKTQSLTGDIYAVKSTFGKTTAQATGATTFHGQVVAQDTTIDLGTAGIKLADGTAANPSTVKGAINVYTTFNGSTNGQLTLDGANTKVDVSGVTSLNVTLNDTTQGRVRTASTIQILDATNTNFVGLAAVTANATGQGAGNNNVQWTFDKSKLQFTSTDVSDKVAASVVAANGGTAEAKQNIVEIFDAVDGTDAASLANEWSTLSNIAPKAEAEAVNRLSSTTANVATTAVTTALAQTVSSTTTARMQTLANPAALRVTQADGVSAGAEDTLRYGVWGSPFYSQSVQKMRKGVSGYKAKTVGGTVGFDTMANDTMIVGVAATVAKTDLKHKDINAGDKTKADTLMFSIYGLQEINNDWFLQGVATFGSTKVKNTSKRIGALNGAVNATTATGKYDSMTWGGELLAGYNLNVSSMAVLTPMLGLDYARTNDGGFTETGTRNQNLTISKKSTDKTQVVAGIRAVMADIEQSGFVITPEVHGFVRQALGNKQPKISVQLDGAGQLATNNTKPAKTNGNLGLGINASSGMMTYGLTYDANLANKYVGHQGTFKVRVNF